MGCWGRWGCEWGVGEGGDVSGVLGKVGMLVGCWGRWGCEEGLGEGGDVSGVLGKVGM